MHMRQCAGPPDELPYQVMSEALVSTDASAASIKIRIVDFGVGKSCLSRILGEHVLPPQHNITVLTFFW